jgi:hypothetical protein
MGADVPARALSGRYRLDSEGSAAIERAIERRAADFGWLTRAIARRRLRETNEPIRLLTLALDARFARITFDHEPPIAAPLDGTLVDWRDADGDAYQVSVRLDGDVMTQTLRAEDGERVNRYRIETGGACLRMDVSVRSPELKAPLEYSLCYLRVASVTT